MKGILLALAFVVILVVAYCVPSVNHYINTQIVAPILTFIGFTQGKYFGQSISYGRGQYVYGIPFGSGDKGIVYTIEGIPYTVLEQGNDLTGLTPPRSTGYSGVSCQIFFNNLNMSSNDGGFDVQENVMLVNQSDSIYPFPSYWLQAVPRFYVSDNDLIQTELIVNIWNLKGTPKLLVLSSSINFTLPNAPVNMTVVTYIGTDNFIHMVYKVYNIVVSDFNCSSFMPVPNCELMRTIIPRTMDLATQIVIASASRYSSAVSGIVPTGLTGQLVITNFVNDVWENPKISLLKTSAAVTAEFTNMVEFNIGNANTVNFHTVSSSLITGVNVEL